MANLPYDIGANPTYRGVQVMRDTVTAVARGEIMGAVIGGGTGIGAACASVIYPKRNFTRTGNEPCAKS